MNFEAHNKLRIFSVLVLSLALLSFVAFGDTTLAKIDYPSSTDVRPGYGVTDVSWLSGYHSSLKDTPGDTRVYVMEGKDTGGSALILGGTHANEPAAHSAAVTLVERGIVPSGTVYVVPFANNSGARYNREEEDVQYFTLENRSGETRKIPVGIRYTQPEDQEPDPNMFIHPQSEYFYPPAQSRNLNRVHPGLPDGNLTQKISYALFQLVKEEEIDVVVDMHEAAPWSYLSRSLICNPKSTAIGSLALLNIEAEYGFSFRLEQSQESSHGLSHREFGDRTSAEAFLIETANAYQGDTDASPKKDLGERVFHQLAIIEGILNAYSNSQSGGSVVKLEFPFDLSTIVGEDGAKLGEKLR